MTVSMRPTWRSLLERDLDLTILDLLHTSPEFASWLYKRTIGSGLTPPHAQFHAAWHSVIGFDGRESDLEVEWLLSDGRRTRVLIEDKIDAQCQPDQALAYKLRAAKYVEDGAAVSVATVLLAPEGYRERYVEDTSLFEYSVSIEMICEWVNAEPRINSRAKYLCGLLDHMLLKYRRARPARQVYDRQAEAVSSTNQFPDFYIFLNGELSKTFPQLEITNSSPGAWVYFSFAGKGAGVSLRYRLRDHWVELVLPKKSFEEDVLRTVLRHHPVQGAFVAQRGGTELALWRPAEELDLDADFEPQRDRIRGALSTVAELAAWYRDHSGHLATAAPANIG